MRVKSVELSVAVSAIENEKNKVIATLLAVGFSTGMRISEITELRWSDLFNKLGDLKDCFFAKVLKKKTEKKREIVFFGEYFKGKIVEFLELKILINKNFLVENYDKIIFCKKPRDSVKKKCPKIFLELKKLKKSKKEIDIKKAKAFSKKNMGKIPKIKFCKKRNCSENCLLNRDFIPMDRFSVYRKISKIADNFGTHGMRKTFAAAAYQSLCSTIDSANALNLVRKLLGHEKVETTFKYLNLDGINDSTVKIINDFFNKNGGV